MARVYVQSGIWQFRRKQDNGRRLNMKILLVDPPGKNKGFNTGLGYLSAILKGSHSVEVLDLNNIEVGLCGDLNRDLPASELEERTLGAIDSFKPDIFGVSVKTFTADVSKEIFRIATRHNPHTVTVAGGPHITLDGLKYVQESHIDFGIQGEGEYSFPQLCEVLEKGEDLEGIEGLICWIDGRIVQNPRSSAVIPLDSLRFPCYDNFSSVISNGCQIKEYPLLTSRGCPYKCSYCSMPKIMGRKWRCSSPQRVIEELKYARERYHSESFTVVDDNLTLDLKRVEGICDLIIAEDLNFKWNSQNGIRADRIDSALAEKMKRSGCKHVWIGVESADERVFKNIDKGEKLEDIKKGIGILKHAGIKVGGFFMIGLPGSTRESDLKSVNFSKDLDIDSWWFYFVPYPRTRAWEWVKANGRVLRPIEGTLQFGAANIEPVFETEEYPKAVRMRTYEEIHIRMGYLDRLFDPLLGQKDNLLKLFRRALSFGPWAVISLAEFVFRYNAKLLIRKLRTRLL